MWKVIVWGALFLSGCQRAGGPAPAASAPRTVKLAKGTPIKLMLMDELTSGGTPEGTKVSLVLAEAIEGVPALSPATATVAWSRTEGTLGGLMNRPARLSLKLETLACPGGEKLTLSADPGEMKECELNRANTGRPEAKETGQQDEALQRALQELVQKGQAEGLDPKQVGDLARKLGMNETAKAAEAGRLNEVQELIRGVRGGGSLAYLATGAPVAAALELVSFAGDVGHRLGRSLGGRNIRAYPGTVIPAYVAQETTITVK